MIMIGCYVFKVRKKYYIRYLYTMYILLLLWSQAIMLKMMIYYTISAPSLLLMLTSLTVSAAQVEVSINVGTTLYNKRDLTKFWTKQEATRLQCRAIVDQLIPRRIPNGTAFINYLQNITHYSKFIIDSENSRTLIMVAVADAIGGYMFGVLLPKIKASYYEDRVSYDLVYKLYGIMRKIK